MNSAKLFFILALVVGSGSPLCLQNCELLRQASHAQQVTYLQDNTRMDNEWPCNKFALIELGRAKPQEALPVLLDYLDNKRPLSEGEKNRFCLHAPSIDNIYSATSALFEIGQPAEAGLLAVVGSDNASEQKRQNAVFAVMQIHRDDQPQGIKLLKQVLLTPAAATELRLNA